SEPGSGSDLASLQCRAAPDGDDFVVNGQKVWTTLAHRSDWIQLFVRTDGEASKHKGISCLLVDMKSPGITVRPLRQMTGDSAYNEIVCEDVRVTKGTLLGPHSGGWQILPTSTMHERAGIRERGPEQTSIPLGGLAKTPRRDGRPASKDSYVRQ